MLLLELFYGTKSVGNVARELGFKTISLDINPHCKPDICGCILDFNSDEFLKTYGQPAIIWASPECKYFSNLSHTNKRFGSPNEAYGNALVLKTLEIISELKPDFYFIENPFTGRLKKKEYMQDIPVRTAHYCRYGWETKKATNIWGSVQGMEFKLCSKKTGECAYKKEHNVHFCIDMSLWVTHHLDPMEPHFDLPAG